MAIGYNVGQNTQGANAIAIGEEAGLNFQSSGSIAIGFRAGYGTQGVDSVAIGNFAGNTNQGKNSIAIGQSAGSLNQSTGCVAIGFRAGHTNQGTNSIAIGYNSGQTNQAQNCISIDATNNGFSQTTASSCVIQPMRAAIGTNAGYLLMASTSTGGEIFCATGFSDSNKTFVIDHPIDSKKYLIHSCVEGPDTELIYRGKNEIINDEKVIIYLPDYATKIGFNWSIHLTPIGKSATEHLSCSEIENGAFIVYCNNGAKFYWIVYGQRTIFNAEPYRDNIDVKGDGPYKWYNTKN